MKEIHAEPSIPLSYPKLDLGYDNSLAFFFHPILSIADCFGRAKKKIPPRIVTSPRARVKANLSVETAGERFQAG